jgi:hypothetical protein
VWNWVFAAPTAYRDNISLMFDGTIVRLHQQAAGRRGGSGAD